MNGPMSDGRIIELCVGKDKPMIDPFVENQVRNGVISYGLSSYGYDIRCADEFTIVSNLYPSIIDPKNFDSLEYSDVYGQDYVVLPPNAFALTRSIEYLRIPRNVVGICIGKSTYARCGLVANITALEPEWEGHLTIELSNTTPLPLKVYAKEGIAQLILFESDNEPIVSYADKQGKYMRQTGITLPKV